uniref:Gypsy retrotransposon integrase-like protein 1 n=1 Tax=Vombatus ursinus TaxID=29139 RepID=A0A4X2L4V7_VOMUR
MPFEFPCPVDGQTLLNWQLIASAPGKMDKVTTMKLLKMTSSPTQSVKRELSLNSNFVLEDGVLYYQGRGKSQQVLFTAEKKWKAFEEAHVVSEDRHHGIRATGVNITKSYYWPGITLDARQWVKECEKCQTDRLAELAAKNAKSQVKAKKHKRKERLVPETDSPSEPKRKRPLEPRSKRERSLSPKRELLPPALAAPTKVAPMAQARGLFHLIGLQLVGPMKQTPRGACFIFVAVDHFTRWVEAAPMKTCSPEETAEQLLKLVYRYGFPERVVSTQSGEFVQQLNQILRTRTNLQCDLVAKYHPQAHGLLEETNAFVKRLLTLVVKRSVANWDLQLPKILFLQKQVEDESAEEDLSSEDELQGGSDSDESLPPAPFPVASPEPPPDGELERVTVAILSMEDMCLYCDQLTDKGNSDVFTMLQCNECQAWAHETCAKQWHSCEDWKTRFLCNACLAGREPSSAPE